MKRNNSEINKGFKSYKRNRFIKQNVRYRRHIIKVHACVSSHCRQIKQDVARAKFNHQEHTVEYPLHVTSSRAH